MIFITKILSLIASANNNKLIKITGTMIKYPLSEGKNEIK